ncbi:hypothetical protein BCR36DRAFT_582091 [Piromyces finnis]|uniref:RING-type domain-containing protein n=1 Tax=Piromyces finnis TaxID=1754191 RepID=A0A1Y1VE36_9FUNG|nr:hypothetical protein BCR36DRAFT_582091 [Piromyces finnis]|eukprot:ORX53866.1 hypothetical protein BCR36DRAFT_582091 [Piromyces finnis]
MDEHEKDNLRLLKNLNIGYVNPVNVNLLCPICRLPLLNPIATPCGHTFCEECILSALEISNNCPYDRKEIKCEEFKKVDRLILNILNELEIYCPNKMNGCPHICQRQFLYEHYHHCEYELVECPHSLCHQKVIKKELQEHSNQCDYKEIECEFCKKIYLQKDKMKHIKNCEEFEKAESSVKEDLIIECKYKKFGCLWQDKLKLVEEHEKSCKYHQFEGFFENVYTKNQRQLETENSELKRKIYQLTDEITELRRELDIYKNNNMVIQQQQAVSESMAELENEVQLLKCDMQNTNLTLNDLEMRYNMMVIDENIRLKEEIQSLRTSFQSIQFQMLSFMKYIKGTLQNNGIGPSFTKPILNQKNNDGSNTSPSTSFLPATYNSSKLIKSASANFDSPTTTSTTTSAANTMNDLFKNYNFPTSAATTTTSHTYSKSDVGTTTTTYDTIRRERRFSKI